MRTRARGLIVPSLFTLVMGAFLIGLGIWQLQRLSWKNAIVEQIEARATAPAEPIPAPNQWQALNPETYEYRHVSLDGSYGHAEEALVFRATAAGPGYFVMTPLRLPAGGTVIVNRGFVPADHAKPNTRQTGQVEGVVHVVGLMRGPEPRNAFTPADNPATGAYFTRDPKTIAAHFGLADAAPFTVDADATPNPGLYPKGGTTEREIPNNHLSYALTWFGLALGLFGVFGAFAWSKLKGQGDPGSDRTQVPASFS